MLLKPLFDITGFTTLDYPGSLAAIFWFAKCNMKCLYCYNPQIVYGEGRLSEANAFDFLKKRKGLLDGIVLSGGEATLYPHLSSFVTQIKEMGFLVKLDTNGLKPNLIKDLIELKLIDRISLDFKAPRNKFENLTANSHFNLFENTLEFLISKKFPFEVRTTVHSGLLNEADITYMGNYLTTKGYTNTYFLQNFLNTGQTIGGIKAPMRDLNRNLISASLPIVWRN